MGEGAPLPVGLGDAGSHAPLCMGAVAGGAGAGCPWNSATCRFAARAGHLEVLQWVLENDATGEAWHEDNMRTFDTGPRMPGTKRC